MDDWRDTDRKLSELPDEQLRTALEAAGVRAVLPSHKKKRRSGFPPPNDSHDATGRWASGDWNSQQVSLDVLPDAQKFLADPEKPPTVAMSKSPMAPQAGVSRLFGGLAWGLLATAAVSALAVAVWRSNPVPRRGDVREIEAPASGSPQAAGNPFSAALAHSASPESSALPQPAGTPASPEASRPRAARLRYLESQAESGDVGSMLALADEAVKAGHGRAARKWARMAKKANRRSIQARILLGDGLMLDGRVVAAERTWRRALARAPRHPELRARLNILNEQPSQSAR